MQWCALFALWHCRGIFGIASFQRENYDHVSGLTNLLNQHVGFNRLHIGWFRVLEGWLGLQSAQKAWEAHINSTVSSQIHAYWNPSGPLEVKCSHLHCFKHRQRCRLHLSNRNWVLLLSSFIPCEHRRGQEVLKLRREVIRLDKLQSPKDLLVHIFFLNLMAMHQMCGFTAASFVLVKGIQLLPAVTKQQDRRLWLCTTQVILQSLYLTNNTYTSTDALVAGWIGQRFNRHSFNTGIEKRHLYWEKT